MTVRILNIAILLVAVVLSALLIKKLFFPPSQNINYQIATNAKLIIEGIDWADSDRTVLLALAKDCKHCTRSAEFYRRLAAGVTSQTNTRLIAVFSDKESRADRYLEQLEIPIREVRYLSLSSLGIKNVPTVAILDRNGVVTDMWVGKLSPLKEAALMSALDLKARSPDEWSINEVNFERKLTDKQQLVLLDVRERNAYSIKHRDFARNIPLDELLVRAQNELPFDHTIVIYSNEPSEADLAYSILDSQGFSSVFVLIATPTQATNSPQK